MNTDFIRFVCPGLPVSKEKELAREILETLKHLAGQHDQMTHGGGGGQYSIYEDQIRDKKVEHGLAFDGDGNLIWNKSTGHTSKIDLTWDDIDKLKGNVFSHNHPSKESFSPDDIKFMIKHKIKEIRVVTSARTYTMKNNPSVTLSKFTKAFRDTLYKQSRGASVGFDNTWDVVGEKLGMPYSSEER